MIKMELYLKEKLLTFLKIKKSTYWSDIFLEDFMDTNNADNPQENYLFLVRKIPPIFQKNRISTISIPKVTNELFSDDSDDDNDSNDGNDDDGGGDSDGVFEKDNE